MQLSIIIVSWNVKALLQRCLTSVYQYTTELEFEVFVVDNASHDGSADMVATEFPQVHLIRNSVNKGFGAANNQALHLARGEYILFLNDDTEIFSNIFETLYQKMSELPQTVAMLGCQLTNPDGSIQESVRSFPTLWDQSIILLKLHHLWPNLIQKYVCKDFDYTREQSVDQVMGAFMWARTQPIKAIGGFDEKYFVWFEEVDMQKTLRQRGYSILYTPLVSCLHVKGQSFKQVRKPKAQLMFNKSLRYYFQKNHSWFAWLWISALQPASLALAYVSSLV
ncbi:MAG: hypothetical protein ACD_43C00264G0004 [uncultured bacterium]|nr:MAG: hypothetical protein ACD_43C00264G0004 [uncultured bacterium]